MSKSKFKRATRQIHLYLGLTSGLVVFIVAITGCCWVFQEEITQAVEGKIEVTAQNQAFLAPHEAKTFALDVFPDKHIHGTKYGRSNEPIEVIFYEREPLFYSSVYLNPYNGEVLKVKNHLSGFFAFVLKGHLYLWLPRKIGSQIMAYGTMVFFVMLLTGIVLWWPKNKKGRKQRFTFDWKDTTKWKRKNFDLHSVVGFYVSFFALLISFSGLIMAFNWMYFVTYKAWGGTNAPQFIIPENISKNDGNKMQTASLIDLLKEEYPDYVSFEYHYPANDSASIYVEISTQEGVYYNSDYRFFDQNTLQEIETTSIYGKYENASVADRVIRMNYDIHVGAIGGIFGKILAFLSSLVTASLPVTGFLLWYGKKMKKKKSKRIKEIKSQHKKLLTPNIVSE